MRTAHQVTRPTAFRPREGAPSTDPHSTVTPAHHAVLTGSHADAVIHASASMQRRSAHTFRHRHHASSARTSKLHESSFRATSLSERITQPVGAARRETGAQSPVNQSAGARVSLPKAALVARKRIHSRTILTFRVKHNYYRVELHGTGGSTYATIKQQTGTPSSTASPSFTSAALAIAQALKNLAETGGGAIGQLVTQFPALMLTLLVALNLIAIGCALRTFAFSPR